MSLDLLLSARIVGSGATPIAKVVRIRLIVRSPLLVIWILRRALQPVRSERSLVGLLLRCSLYEPPTGPLNHVYLLVIPKVSHLPRVSSLLGALLVFQVSGAGKVIDQWQFNFVFNIPSSRRLSQHLLFLNFQLIGNWLIGCMLRDLSYLDIPLLVLEGVALVVGVEAVLVDHTIARRVLKGHHAWVLLSLSLPYVGLWFGFTIELDRIFQKHASWVFKILGHDHLRVLIAGTNLICSCFRPQN